MPHPLRVLDLVAALNVPDAFGQIVVLDRRATQLARRRRLATGPRDRATPRAIRPPNTARGSRRSRHRAPGGPGARRERTPRASRSPRRRTPRALVVRCDRESIGAPVGGSSPTLNTRPHAIDTPFSRTSRSSPTRAGTSHCSPSSKMPTMNAASAGNTSDGDVAARVPRPIVEPRQRAVLDEVEALDDIDVGIPGCRDPGVERAAADRERQRAVPHAPAAL